VEAIDAFVAKLPVFVPPEMGAVKDLQNAVADGSSPSAGIALCVTQLAHSLLEYDIALVFVGRIVGVFRQARLHCLLQRWAETAECFPFKTPARNRERDALLQALRQEAPDARIAPLTATQAKYYAQKLEAFHGVVRIAAETIQAMWPSLRKWCEAATVKEVVLEMNTCEFCRGPLLPDRPCELCAIHSFL
jgi:hypothetical protein